MGVRLYDPPLGTFLEVDPVEGGSANDYDYCGGGLINCFDLGGTKAKTVVQAVVNKVGDQALRDLVSKSTLVGTQSEVTRHDPVAGGLTACWGPCVGIPNWEEARRGRDSYVTPEGNTLIIETTQVRANRTICCGVGIFSYSLTQTSNWKTTYVNVRLFAADGTLISEGTYTSGQTPGVPRR